MFELVLIVLLHLDPLGEASGLMPNPSVRQCGNSFLRMEDRLNT